MSLMIELILSVTLATFFKTEDFVVESCINEEFSLIQSFTPKRPLHTERIKSEAFVDIKFDVNKYGDVVDIKVVNSFPARIFDRESARALKKWKFNTSTNPNRCFDVRFKFKPLD